MGKFKHLVILPLLFTFFFIGQHSTAQGYTYPYAYISITDRTFSDKLNVKVDLGDSSDQLIEGKRLSEFLSEKTSYASVLNYMSGLGFELVETISETHQDDGDGGTSAIIFIMRKKG